jgi:hypothetical protein
MKFEKLDKIPRFDESNDKSISKIKLAKKQQKKLLSKILKREEQILSIDAKREKITEELSHLKGENIQIRNRIK